MEISRIAALLSEHWPRAWILNTPMTARQQQRIFHAAEKMKHALDNYLLHTILNSPALLS